VPKKLDRSVKIMKLRSSFIVTVAVKKSYAAFGLGWSGSGQVIADALVELVNFIKILEAAF
jgi:hypothetical protein